MVMSRHIPNIMREWARTENLGVIAAALAVAVSFGVAIATFHTPAHHKTQKLVLHASAKPIVQKPSINRKSVPSLVATVKAPKPIRAPSDFEKEQAMSFHQLMSRWDAFIAEAARKYDVPQPWIRAVMQAESGGRTMLAENRPITSTAGAMGLMQLMPQTYDDMRRQYRLGANPYDPHDNIMAGAAYLRFLRGKYPYPAMFAAYNDGPGNLEARLVSGGLLPAETQAYVGHITNTLENGGIGGSATARFTRPNGEAVMLYAAGVVSVRAAFPGEYAPGVQSVITVGRLHQGVRESVARAKAIIRSHGGGV
jgi:soluble lytic murein transglycosylase-like protein